MSNHYYFLNKYAMTVQNNNILSGSKQGKVVMLGLILACGKIVYHIEVEMPEMAL